MMAVASGDSSPEWDEVVDEAVTEAVYSLGLVQHFADEDDRFNGIEHPGGGGIDLSDVCAEVRAMLRDGMKEAGYTLMRPVTAEEEAENVW